MYSIYHEIVFRPLYNGLIGIMNVLPFVDVGIAVIIFTAIVKVILFPLSKSSLLTQVRMKEIEPEINKIKKQYESDKQAQALKTMELYKSKGIKPFSGILLLIIQLPILLSLISVFYKIIPTVDVTQLYSFIHAPVLKTMFLGFIDLTTPSSLVFSLIPSGLVLALLTAVAQFLQLKYSIAAKQAVAKSDAKSADTAVNIANSMNTQMKYMVPILAFASIYWLIPARFPQAAGIIAIYWMTSTLMTFLQELVIQRNYLTKSSDQSERSPLLTKNK